VQFSYAFNGIGLNWYLYLQFVNLIQQAASSEYGANYNCTGYQYCQLPKTCDFYSYLFDYYSIMFKIDGNDNNVWVPFSAFAWNNGTNC
jgi:hypothetical protein